MRPFILRRVKSEVCFLQIQYGKIWPICTYYLQTVAEVFLLLFTDSINISCFFQVLKQLPPKQDHIKFCPLSKKQQQMYNDLMNKLKRSVEGTGNLYQIKLAIDGSNFGRFSSNRPSFDQSAVSTNQCILTGESPAVRMQCPKDEISSSTSFVWMD